MKDLEKAISEFQTIISNINEELGKIDKNATDYLKIVNKRKYKIELEIDRDIYQHALIC